MKKIMVCFFVLLLSLTANANCDMDELIAEKEQSLAQAWLELEQLEQKMQDAYNDRFNVGIRFVVMGAPGAAFLVAGHEMAKFSVEIHGLMAMGSFANIAKFIGIALVAADIGYGILKIADYLRIKKEIAKKKELIEAEFEQLQGIRIVCIPHQL